MRGLWRGIGARAGISAGLVVIIAAILLIARLAGGGERTPPPPYTGEPALPSVTPSAGDDGRLVSAAPSDPAQDAEIRDAALAFTTAWLRRDLASEEWHGTLAPLSTAPHAQSLESVDPSGVPATRVVGEVTIPLRSDLYAQVSVPVDSGVLELGLLHEDGRWLVDSVDWQRS